jgi:carboxylesterase type B
VARIDTILRFLGVLSPVLTQRAAGGGVAYAYYFARAIPWPEQPRFAAFHSGELPYVFDNLRLLNRPWTSDASVLAVMTRVHKRRRTDRGFAHGR